MLDVPAAESSELNNGLRVVSENWNTATCTVGLYIDAGSRCETAENNGAAHFLEHLAFKGTATRSQEDIEMDVEHRGASLHAHTSREMTVYYAKCLSKDVPWAVELLADVVRHASLEERQVEAERAMILQELHAAEHDLETVAFDYLHATAYQGTPLARTVIGSEDNVASGLTRELLTQYARNHFLAPRIVLAGAGAIEHGALHELAGRHLGELTANPAFEIPAMEPCRYTGSELRDRDDAWPLAHVAMAVQAPGWTSPDAVPLMLASTLMGSWDRTQGSASSLSVSRLAASGLHSYRAFSSGFADTSLWGVHIAAGKLEVGDAMAAIVKEWIRLCTSVTDFELQRAKNALKTQLLLQLDGTTEACHELGRHTLRYKRRIPLEEMETRIDAVDQAQLRATLSHYIYDRCPVVASVGPTEAVIDYMMLRDKMWWMRL